MPKQTNKSDKEKKLTLLTTGLEDYGKWVDKYKNHKRDKNEPPFRRGRIWA